MPEVLKSLFIVVFTIVIFLVLDWLPFHYVLIPISLCGWISLYWVLIYVGRSYALRNTFFYVWVVFFLTSFIAPLIHFGRDYWIEHVYLYPKDWKHLSFISSSIYLYGILVFSFVSNVIPDNYKSKSVWIFKPNADVIVLALMLISFALQTYFYLSIGGIMGYMEAFTAKESGINAFSGMGFFFIFSEMFPYFFMLWFFIKMRGATTSFLYVSIFLILLFLSSIYFGGLRGSRSNTVFTIVNAVILIHYTIYRFKKVHLIVFVFAFFVFMTLGRLYKSYGVDLITNETNIESYQISKNMSSIEIIVLGDLTRYNIMAYEIFMMENNPTFEKAYGSTYLYALLTNLPMGQALRDFLRLRGRTEVASELQFDFDGLKYSENRKNSRIFGFIGEGILNFGIFSFVFMFILLAFILSLIHRIFFAIQLYDARFFIVPMLAILVPLIINADFNNLIYTVVKRYIPMLIVLYFITHRSMLPKQY